MAATYQDIASWFDEGAAKGATHLAVFCDTWDWTDYPVFITATDAEDAKKQIAAQQDRLMEVYHLGSDKRRQMREHRAFHYEPLED